MVQRGLHCLLVEDVDSITHCKRKIFVLKITLINHNTHMSSFPSTRSAYNSSALLTRMVVVAHTLPNYSGSARLYGLLLHPRTERVIVAINFGVTRKWATNVGGVFYGAKTMPPSIHLSVPTKPWPRSAYTVGSGGAFRWGHHSQQLCRRSTKITCIL